MNNNKKKNSSDIGISTVNSWWQHQKPGKWRWGGERWDAELQHKASCPHSRLRSPVGLLHPLVSIHKTAAAGRSAKKEEKKTCLCHEKTQRGRSTPSVQYHKYVDDCRRVYQVHMVQKQKIYTF